MHDTLTPCADGAEETPVAPSSAPTWRTPLHDRVPNGAGTATLDVPEPGLSPRTRDDQHEGVIEGSGDVAASWTRRTHRMRMIRPDDLVTQGLGRTLERSHLTSVEHETTGPPGGVPHRKQLDGASGVHEQPAHLAVSALRDSGGFADDGRQLLAKEGTRRCHRAREWAGGGLRPSSRAYGTTLAPRHQKSSCHGPSQSAPLRFEVGPAPRGVAHDPPASSRHAGTRATRSRRHRGTRPHARPPSATM